MPPDKPFESQGFRLLRELFCRGKRIFEIQDIKNAGVVRLTSSQVGQSRPNLEMIFSSPSLLSKMWIKISLTPKRPTIIGTNEIPPIKFVTPKVKRSVP